MTGYFVFGGRCSKDFGLYISGSGAYNAPERDVEQVEIPGKNGNLLIDNGRFKNISVTYPAFIRQKFKELAKEAREWLFCSSSYLRLEDSYNPEYFRLARFGGPLDFETRALNRSGECSLVFDCKPQRFLLEGDFSLPVDGSLDLYNPTPYAAFPFIRVYGTDGVLHVGGNVNQLSEIDEYVDIDCENMNVYKGAVNYNSKFTGSFPVLPKGKTGISYEGNITKVEIKPRWWTI